MSKKLCLIAPIAALTGNYDAVDEHGHKTTLRFREFSPSNKKYFGIGYKKRNLETNPLSENETMQRQLFKSAAGLTKVALGSPAKKAQWQERFAEDKEGCSTLRGYVMKQAFAGHVSTEGNWE